MADVTEVIHRITYEVNNDALNNATAAIQAQLAELERLSKALDDYSRQLSKLSTGEAKQLEALSRQIDDLGGSIDKLAGKSKGILNEIFKGVATGIAGSDGLKKAVATYVSGIVEQYKKLDEAGKVVVGGFANRAGTATTANDKMSASLGKLGKSLGSVTGLVDIGINLLVAFADELDSADEKLGLVTGSLNAMNEVNRSAAADIAKVSTEIEVMKSRFFDANATVRDKTEVVKELNEKYGDTIGQIKGIAEAEEFFIKKSDAFVRAITIRAQIQGAYNLIASNQQKLLEGQAAAPGDNVSGLKKAGLFFTSLFSKPGQLRQAGPNPNATRFSIDYDNAIKAENEKFLNEAATETQKTFDFLQGEIKSLLILLEQINTENGFNVESVTPTSNNRRYATNKRTSSKRVVREKGSLQYLSTRSSQLPVSIGGTIQPVDTERLQKQAEEEQKKKDEENKAKRKENIKSAIDDYKTLSDAAVEAYNKIIQAQIDALDKEISLREKRVEEAKKLAERGNVEALRLEEERLRKAQEQRARFARQQQIVNSAITVSNAIAAVARAALEGGGFGSAATIAALIAALAAGYAAVTSLGSSADSFADGVVGYKGKGGPRDDKNWVRISSGESIITAEGTQKNRALLEAINQGAALHMIDPSLPLMIPTFKQPGVTNNNYAAAKDLKQLEGKLDEVVGAIEDNRLRQNIFFNEQGVGIMTERAIKKERKRWM